MTQNSRFELNKQLAQMLKGGVIMDVTNAEQARIAEEAGACAVMALERIPADIRAAGGVSRMSDPRLIKEIQNAVSIPVMAKVRIGHFVEPKSWKPWKSITSTNPKFSPQPITSTTSTRMIFLCHSCVARRILAKPSAVLLKAPP